MNMLEKVITRDEDINNEICPFCGSTGILNNI